MPEPGHSVEPRTVSVLVSPCFSLYFFVLCFCNDAGFVIFNMGANLGLAKGFYLCNGRRRPDWRVSYETSKSLPDARYFVVFDCDCYRSHNLSLYASNMWINLSKPLYRTAMRPW